ncbi:hypothetical protein [Bacillus sp. FJAT-50079]|uniref:stalk domain-containing protein n=1 Tax=Bacillus sp. FJAT-50079 TaxID=2833577 RepID=UPI001BC9D3AF|nr:hypothetical protein [Bacillus sp. FJAT-50079]MBS4207740.1 hypothetical protein [Bacillus sp. FJAT-50079]
MKFKILSMIVILVSLIGSLLFFQWKGYSTALDDQEPIHLKQTIKINHQPKMFKIEHSISRLPADEILTIELPAKAENVTWSTEKQSSSQFEEKTIVGDGSDIRLVYSIPAPETPKSFLFNDWGAQIQSHPVTLTALQINEAVWRTGNWVAPAKLIGHKQMNYLDYYIFEINGEIPALYWQQEPLEITYEDDQFVLYGRNDLQLALTSSPPKAMMNQVGDLEPLHIIYTDIHKETDMGQLKIINSEGALRAIQAEKWNQTILQLFAFPEAEKWLVHVIVSQLLNHPIGPEKAQQMYVEMNEKLTEKEREQWLERLLSHGKQEMDSGSLDHYLPAEKGLDIQFFSANSNIDKPLVPLFYFDKRKIIINGEKSSDAHIIYQEGKTYITMKPLLSALGYEIEQVAENEVIAKKGSIHYQFYPNKRLFQLNQHQYGVENQPVISIFNQNYIDYALIMTFFHLNISEGETEILIRSIMK